MSRQKQQELRARRKREFQNTTYNPNESDDDSENEEDAFDRHQFTNLKAPEISTETHFGVKKLDIGVQENDEEKPAGGFSLLSMFDRPAAQDEEDDGNEEEQAENNATVRKAPPQVKRIELIFYPNFLKNQFTD